MVTASFSLREDYWENFELRDEDIEFLYNYLLETETPLTSQELVETMVEDRIRREKAAIEEQRTSGGDIYLPKDNYQVDQTLIFPALDWRRGTVVNVRSGHNPDLGEFEVIEVAFDEDGEETREYASGLDEHTLNDPPQITEEEESLSPEYVLDYYQDVLVGALEKGLETHTDFVRIAGRWFPRALLVDINVGHLNLAEAVLDMEGGGPAETPDLLNQIELESNVNPKLLEFSLDLALQEDERFDEVGSAGKVLWFLKRLEPAEVLEPPSYLRYPGMDYERSILSNDMRALERELDDELSPIAEPIHPETEVDVRLIFPHWRAGTLPLSSSVRHLFPTAYEAPRIQFTLVDEDSEERYSAWVVRAKRYVYGLKEWYEKRELLPGSIITVKQGDNPGEVIINSDSRRSSREWVRTVLVGSDGGIVYAMLKQIINSGFDERMVIAVPDPEAIDQIWEKNRDNPPPFERTVANTVRELSKLNPQSHVHATELYAAINVVRRCPPGPILSLLASRPWFVHVGDLHFRFNDSEGA